MGILTGKNIVVTGVLTDASLAFGVAQLAQREGAKILLTGAGRGMSITERTARKLDTPVPVVEFDVTVEAHVESARAAALENLGRVDGVLHSIGFAPAVCLGDDFMAAKWNDVAIAMQISAYSLKTLADAFAPLMTAGGSLVGLDFDNTVAWPAYNWMGVAKSALESTSRYLAKELGGRKSAATLLLLARSKRWPQSQSQGSKLLRTCGMKDPLLDGTSTTQLQLLKRALRFFRIGSPPPQRRLSC
jgi:meromycolic acid enoyl-[acyl-carrier-protein] reductase